LATPQSGAIFNRVHAGSQGEKTVRKKDSGRHEKKPGEEKSEGLLTLTVVGDPENLREEATGNRYLTAALRTDYGLVAPDVMGHQGEVLLAERTFDRNDHGRSSLKNLSSARE